MKATVVIKQHLIILTAALWFLSVLPVFCQTTPDLKITVSSKGMYSVSYRDLEDAGWSPASIEPQNLQLSSQGKDVPILFYVEEDGLFNQGDYFIFYGEPFESDMTHENAINKFTVDNVYWLSAGDTAGLRMEQIASSYSETDMIETVTETVRMEEDRIMSTSHIDYFLWKKFPDYDDTERSDPLADEFSCDLVEIDNLQEALLRIKLKGGNDIPDINPDHHMRVSVNGVWSDDVYLEAWNTDIYESTVTAGVLQEFDNHIVLKNMMDLSALDDLIILDWIDIAYQRQCVAQENEFLFSAGAEKSISFRIRGFSNDSLMLFDITDPFDVKAVSLFETVKSDGENELLFGNDAEGSKTYYALSEQSMKKPVSVEPYAASDLTNTDNQADYLIIIHEDFSDEIVRLSSYRENDGYTVKTVTIQDVYDAFNYGVVHPSAIRDFLKYVYSSWKQPFPEFVLLVGDGSTDATDRLNFGNKNYIPVKMDSTFTEGSGPDDSWYGDVYGDDNVQDILIARLPVQTNAQLKNIIDKIIDYENSTRVAWMRQALFVSGDDPYFEDINDDLAQYFPFNYSVDYHLRSGGESPSNVIENINYGRAMVFYSGHGNITGWNGIISTGALSEVKPNNKPLFLMTLDCFNGHFSHPTEEGLAEEFLRVEDGGALACFAPVAAGYSFEHHEIARRLLLELFSDNNTVLGKAAFEAKKSAYEDGWITESAYNQFIFLGDPATKFKVCEFYLETPENRAVIDRGDSFSWVGDGFTNFLIQFSYTPEFAAGQTVPAFVINDEYRPGPVVWSMLNTMGRRRDVVFWRVGGLPDRLFFTDILAGLRNDAVFTDPLSFTVGGR